MKSFLILLFSLLLSVSVFETASADDMSLSGSSPSTAMESPSPMGTPLVNSNLSVKSVKVIDDAHIQVIFSEDIDVSSVKVQLVKQSDHSSFRVMGYTGVVSTPSAVEISLNSNLQEGTSYSITVLSVLGKSGTTISDGALALKDFITPIPLKKSAPPTLNAPSNPNAVTAITGSVSPEKTVSGSVLAVSGSGSEDKKPETPSELPLTGANPLFLLLAILPLSYLFLRKRA